MDIDRKELEQANGDNAYFAAIAWELYEDFEEEGQKFSSSACHAAFKRQKNLFTGDEEVMLVVNEVGNPYHRVTLTPSTTGHIPCAILTVSDAGDSVYSIVLYKEDTPEYRALEVARITCAAAFRLVAEEYKEESDD